MGAVLVEVCGRCGTPKGEGMEWTKTGLHRCVDGIIGELAQVDPNDHDNFPTLEPKFLEPQTHLRIVKRAKDGEDHYWMIVSCHKCGVEIRGDYPKEEADAKRYQLFNCSGCGEWQEWMMHLIDGDPLPLKQWKPFDWSKVPTSREESRRLLKKMIEKLKTPGVVELPLDDLAKMQQPVSPGQPVYLQTGSPAAPNPAGASNTKPPAEPKLKEFSRDAIENAMNTPSCRAPICTCPSCGRNMKVKVWSERSLKDFYGYVQEMPMLVLKDGRKIVVEVLYHCDVCYRDELFVRDQTPPNKQDANGRYMGATLHGQWYKWAGTFFKDKVWNPETNWRKPDAILSTTPIKAQGSDQTPVF